MNTKRRVLGGCFGFYLLIILVAMIINARFETLNEIEKNEQNKIAYNQNK